MVRGLSVSTVTMGVRPTNRHETQAFRFGRTVRFRLSMGPKAASYFAGAGYGFSRRVPARLFQGSATRPARLVYEFSENALKAVFVYAATIPPVLIRNRMTAAQQAIKAAASVPATINNVRGGQLFLSGAVARSTT